jgi:hypothetical protein
VTLTDDQVSDITNKLKEISHIFMITTPSSNNSHTFNNKPPLPAIQPNTSVDVWKMPTTPDPNLGFYLLTAITKTDKENIIKEFTNLTLTNIEKNNQLLPNIPPIIYYFLKDDATNKFYHSDNIEPIPFLLTLYDKYEWSTQHSGSGVTYNKYTYDPKKKIWYKK